ncbi:DUF6053 domain-containing protein [Lysobacter enzymogenes]|uniref:DUF6053 domain-containing protein n=1 Tax=Lysobacter enzymogenes TaxID=69 RepID=UPI003D18E2ED
MTAVRLLGPGLREQAPENPVAIVLPVGGGCPGGGPSGSTRSAQFEAVRQESAGPEGPPADSRRLASARSRPPLRTRPLIAPATCAGTGSALRPDASGTSPRTR